MIDVRRVIGGLFLVYGVIVTTVGIFDSRSQIAKAQGMRINLWAGLGMGLLGLVFLGWQLWRPLEVPQRDARGESSAESLSPDDQPPETS